MDLKKGKKVLGRLGVLYGIIISLVNFLGFKITSSGQMPVRQTENFAGWIHFMEVHQTAINIMSVACFIIPALVCFFYIFTRKPEKVERRLINIPFMYALFGALGWILSFLLETVFLFLAKKDFGIQIFEIIKSSLLNIVQLCLFIFTAAYLCLDSIHRKFVLPKVFPDGNLTGRKGSFKISTRILFTFFFLSVSIFPIFFLASSLYNYSMEYNFSIQKSVFIVLALIIVFGVMILIAFSDYFSVPLEKLLKATKRIKSSEYDQKVDVVSCDDLGELADNFNEMAAALAQKTKKIQEVQDSVIRGMAVMVESRDNSTGGHINRTSDCVKVFIEKLREDSRYSILSDSFCQAVIKAAPMHDLGKIAVDDAILRKPGRFTDEEYEKMKMHSAEGAKIVENVTREVDDLEFKQIAINVAHYHHEKWDGSGYPEKIKGEEIPFEARIMALADVFDALVSKRCYKDSMSYDKAFQIIEESLGTHFDPELGSAFIKCRPYLEDLYNSY